MQAFIFWGVAVAAVAASAVATPSVVAQAQQMGTCWFHPPNGGPAVNLGVYPMGHCPQPPQVNAVQMGTCWFHPSNGGPAVNLGVYPMGHCPQQPSSLPAPQEKAQQPPSRHAVPRDTPSAGQVADDCGGGRYCNPGMKCASGNQCIALDAVDCGNGRSCRGGLVCVNGGLQCLTSEEREVQQRASAQEQQFAARWNSCKRYNISECQLALELPQANNGHNRDQLLAWLSVAQRFQIAMAACKNGTSTSCDDALSSPAASGDDRQNIERWRAAAAASATLFPEISTVPQSTLVVGGVAVALGLILIVLLIRNRRFSHAQTVVTTGSEIIPSETTAPIQTFTAGTPQNEGEDKPIASSDSVPIAELGAAANESLLQAEFAKRPHKEPGMAQVMGNIESGALHSQLSASPPAPKRKYTGQVSKGFGIAALIVAILAIPIPFGIFISAVAIVLAVVSALSGDRMFATATVLIAGINTFLLSPSTWISLNQSTGHVFLAIVCIFLLAPFVSMFVNSYSRALWSIGV